MRRGARTRRGGTTAALLAAVMTASLAAGCSSGGGTAPDDGRGPVQQPDSGTVREPDTGTVAAADSVLAVKIDNSRRARPHTGLNSADIIYVEQVEGGMSRLMAVYASKLPNAVGPVRSARESDLELLRQFEQPTLAYSGAQSKLNPLIDDAPLRSEPPGRTPGAYYRGTDRPAPHNLYLRPAKLMPTVPGATALTTGFTYGAAPAGGKADTAETVSYPAASFSFTWSASRGRWLVAMDGTNATTTDTGRLAPATVVVQYVKLRKSEFFDSLGNNTPFTETVGTGRAKVLRDGKAFDVTWSRPTATDGTRFETKDGTRMNFAEGQVWVVFAKA
ncbi:DUF3048 domain-containing protein [Streptomyces sp. enrichment culture]|uniref:DUF3048 domain-containing protein n=1 Tax=Streptomyces sp. enrichment culture TaxID=1795815 RepID=UPI003F5462D0